MNKVANVTPPSGRPQPRRASGRLLLTSVALVMSFQAPSLFSPQSAKACGSVCATINGTFTNGTPYYGYHCTAAGPGAAGFASCISQQRKIGNAIIYYCHNQQSNVCT
jgi:hypothetical protein